MKFTSITQILFILCRVFFKYLFYLFFYLFLSFFFDHTFLAFDKCCTLNLSMSCAITIHSLHSINVIHQINYIYFHLRVDGWVHACIAISHLIISNISFVILIYTILNFNSTTKPSHLTIYYYF